MVGHARAQAWDAEVVFLEGLLCRPLGGSASPQVSKAWPWSGPRRACFLQELRGPWVSVNARLAGMLGTRVPHKLVLPLGGKRQVGCLVITGSCTPTRQG